MGILPCLYHTPPCHLIPLTQVMPANPAPSCSLMPHGMHSAVTGLASGYTTIGRRWLWTCTIVSPCCYAHGWVWYCAFYYCYFVAKFLYTNVYIPFNSCQLIEHISCHDQLVRWALLSTLGNTPTLGALGEATIVCSLGDLRPPSHSWKGGELQTCHDFPGWCCPGAPSAPDALEPPGA